MTSATEELRALLDARGVEWDYGVSGPDSTMFRANGVDLTFTPMRDGLVCSTVLTPAQAVEATLGRGTCRIRGGECDQCGAYIHEDACLNWVLVGEGMKTFERSSVNFCPNCGREVVE